jgi:hypothetical protein
MHLDNELKRLKATQSPPAQNAPAAPTSVMEDTQAEIDQLKQGMNVPSPDTRMQAMQAGREALPSGGLPSLPAPNIGSAAMASGGIVAFNGEQGSAVSSGQPDVTKMSNEELRLLAKSPDINTARSANREMLNRSGYEPSAFPSSEVISQRFREAISTDKPTRIRYDERPLPSHMYDESGVAKVRSNPETARFFGPQPSEGSAPGVAPATAFGAAPTADAAPATATPNAWGLGGASTRNRATFPDMLPEQAAPEQDPNAEFFRKMEAIAGSSGSVRAPKLNAADLYKDVSLSDAERAKIGQETAARAEASGLPGLLRSGAARTEADIASAKKDKRTETALLFAQLGFGVATSSSPFGVALGEMGSKFAAQYAQINKDLKKEVRELNKEAESYKRSMAEFNINQDDKSRAEVVRREAALERRQDNAAKLYVEQQNLNLKASIATLQADDGARERMFRLYAAQIKDTSAAAKLSEQYARAVATKNDAERDRILTAVAKFNAASPQVQAAQQRQPNNPDAVVGENPNSDGFSDFREVKP